MVEHLPASREILSQSIDIRLDLRHALLPLGALDQVFEHLTAAESIAETLKDEMRLAQISTYLKRS